MHFIWHIVKALLCIIRSCFEKKNATENLQNFGAVLFSVISVVNGFTEIKKTPNVRGHLKSSHIADEQRTFIWEGEGLDPIRCAIDSKKKKNALPSTDRAATLADKSKSPIKCC